MPDTISEKLLAAPSVSPDSIAFAVPMAWAAVPMQTPFAILCVRRHLRMTKSETMLPYMPVKMMIGDAIPTSPPKSSAIVMPIAVVIDFGKKVMYSEKDSRSSLATSKMLSRLTKTPLETPTRIGVISVRNLAKFLYKGTAKAIVAGVRFNIFRGNSASITDLVEFSKRIHAVAGWHVEVQINPDELGTIKEQLKEIPRLSIDHIGLRKSGIEHLYDLADSGVKIKASGFGRLDFEPMPVLSKIHQINKKCLMFGTDLPSTRVQADKVFSETHIQKMTETFSSEELEDIMFNNAYNWYIKKT